MNFLENNHIIVQLKMSLNFLENNSSSSEECLSSEKLSSSHSSSSDDFSSLGGLLGCSSSSEKLSSCDSSSSDSYSSNLSSASMSRASDVLVSSVDLLGNRESLSKDNRLLGKLGELSEVSLSISHEVVLDNLFLKDSVGLGVLSDSSEIVFVVSGIVNIVGASLDDSLLFRELLGLSSDDSSSDHLSSSDDSSDDSSDGLSALSASSSDDLPLKMFDTFFFQIISLQVTMNCNSSWCPITLQYLPVIIYYRPTIEDVYKVYHTSLHTVSFGLTIEELSRMIGVGKLWAKKRSNSRVFGSPTIKNVRHLYIC